VSSSFHAPAERRRKRTTPFESVALVLQGGGALGAYQAGVYEALVEHGVEPTWVSGISIGAINSAIIAGNPAEARVDKLRQFWELVSDHGDGGISAWWSGLFNGDTARTWINQAFAAEVMLKGIPGFFAPRVPPPYLEPRGSNAATSWYDTSVLKETLERLVDFDRINAKDMRFSVGAVELRTGNFAYFDNESCAIRPEHIMASGALPPAFPPIEISGEYYWDGGLVSNTPLDWVLSAPSHLNTLVFQVDLWSARGALPRDLGEVAVRMKEIQYSSRTRAATDQFRSTQRMRAAVNELLAQMPEKLKALPEAKLLVETASTAVYGIAQLIYHPEAYEGQAKDFEFSRRTMEQHWRAGHRDAVKTLSHPEVLKLPTCADGIAVYDFTAAPSKRAATTSPKEHKP
jgi:NTE family protein